MKPIGFSKRQLARVTNICCLYQTRFSDIKNKPLLNIEQQIDFLNDIFQSELNIKIKIDRDFALELWESIEKNYEKSLLLIKDQVDFLPDDDLINCILICGACESLNKKTDSPLIIKSYTDICTAFLAKSANFVHGVLNKICKETVEA